LIVCRRLASGRPFVGVVVILVRFLMVGSRTGGEAITIALLGVDSMATH
jgi:hypothetical protein